jgi:quercetin dioxygenase-like cupin family protein
VRPTPELETNNERIMDMSLFAASQDVPEVRVEMKLSGGQLSTKQAFGLESSMMIARRSPGYHSRPHAHNSEQLNYVAEGEIWIYIEDKAFHLRFGDFLRVPRLAVHWAWNKSERDCMLIESHTPGLDILPRDKTVALLDHGEDESQIARARQIWASDDYLTVEKK